jgi:ArsR family transcriptional regulator
LRVRWYHFDKHRFDVSRYDINRSKDVNMSSAANAASVPALCCSPLTGGRLDEAAAIELAGVLRALADPVRLQLVSIVAAAPEGEVCACDLPPLVGRSQATTSHHLSVLVRAGVFAREQRGKWAWFSLRPDMLAAVRGALGEGIRLGSAAGA